MINGGIEDILISRDYNTKKKKGKGFFVIFFILLLILGALIGAYWYFSRENVSSKELFVQNISKVNVNKLLKNEIYTNIFNKIQSESSEILSSVNFTTDLEKEELQDIDITKFKLDVSNLNDIPNKKNYNEAVLNYSGNEIFKANLVTAENEVAISSSEILDKYVGLHLDKIEEVFGIEINFDDINGLKNAENISFTEEELNEIFKNYSKLILDNIPEEKFELQENIAIQNATEDVAVTNYYLSLNQDELNALIIKVLENVKEDEELINKIAVKDEETENNNESETPIIESVPNQEENGMQEEITDENSNSQEENLNSDIPIITINPVGTISATPLEQNENQVLEEENLQAENVSGEDASEENALDEEAINEEVSNEDIETVETTNIEELMENEKDISEYLLKIALGKKVELTGSELKSLIDELIAKVNKISGDGIRINVYASEKNVEKINIVLPNANIIDLDFLPDGNAELNSNESYIKITYLYENEEVENTKNGFSLEINKEQSSASTSIFAEYSFIESEKINKKIKLNLKTDGTVNSKELTNEIVITLSTNNGETQVAIDNEIKFKEVTDLPGLNNENCIYLDVLPLEERQAMIEDLKSKITNLYTSKKENLNFIDTNTYSQETLENEAMNSTQIKKVTREEAKEALINKVSTMMQEALDRNEEFTIQNLVDLKIDGYKVSSAVTRRSSINSC